MYVKIYEIYFLYKSEIYSPKYIWHISNPASKYIFFNIASRSLKHAFVYS